jgi:hypothetical protein
MATPHLLGTGQFDIQWESLYGEHGVNASLALRGTLNATRFLPGAALTVSVRVKAQGLQQRDNLYLGFSESAILTVGHPMLSYANDPRWATDIYPHQVDLHISMDSLALEELEQCRQGRQFQLLIDSFILLANPGRVDLQEGDRAGHSTAQVQQNYYVEELEWAAVLNQWRRGVGVPIVVSIPQPLTGGRTSEIVGLIVSSWRKINDGDYQSAIIETRKAVELLRKIDPSANLPPKATDRTVDDRVNAVLDALFALASSPTHADGATANFIPERSDAVAVAGAAAAMANAVFRRIERMPQILKLLPEEEAPDGSSQSGELQ